MAAASAVARAISGPARLQGIDLARGLAVLGMLAAHLVALPTWDWRDPATWTDIVNGRSSILFATLAGVSIGLVSGGSRPLPVGPALARARRALAARAALLWVIGLALIATHVPVFVILPAYALLFLLAVPLLRLRARTLWVLAGVLALVTPWLQPVVDALPLWRGEPGAVLVLVVGWHYPAPIWATFLVAGLAAARSDLTAPRTPVALLAAGGGVAALAAALDAVTGIGSRGDGSFLATVLSARPHSGGLLEVAGSGGFALAVVGLCLLACRLDAVAAVSFPLRAVGSMPLTAYTGQILVWAVVAAVALGDVGDLDGMRGLGLFWAFAIGTVAFCTLWAMRWGRGPLESLVARVVRWVVPPDGPGSKRGIGAL